MKRLDSITLPAHQHRALIDLRQRLLNTRGIEAIILYGSAARGEADEESDLDLLILTRQPLTRVVRHEITDIVFEVNLRYDTNFSTLVVDRNSWEVGPVSVLSLRNDILKDGVLV